MPTVTNYKYGDKGEGVLALQRQLNAQGYGLAENSSFGPKTQAALMDFQKKNNLTVDGIYGSHTAGAFANLGTQPATTYVTPPPANNANTLPQTNTSTQTGTQTGSPYDWKFNYDVTKDVGFNNATSLAKSRIAEEMAARGIGGSTIEQERIAQSIAGLNLDYTNAAYQKFSQGQQLAIQKDIEQYNRQRQAKADALEKVNTVLNGVFDNESAKLWGVPPGTRTSDRIARDAQAVQDAEDRRAKKIEEANKELINKRYDDILKANQSFFNTNPVQAVNSVLDNTLLSPTEKQNMISSLYPNKIDRDGNIIPVAGKTGMQVLADIMQAAETKLQGEYTRGLTNRAKDRI